VYSNFSGKDDPAPSAREVVSGPLTACGGRPQDRGEAVDAGSTENLDAMQLERVGCVLNEAGAAGDAEDVARVAREVCDPPVHGAVRVRDPLDGMSQVSFERLA
jgi:hypothetical protein